MYSRVVITGSGSHYNIERLCMRGAVIRPSSVCRLLRSLVFDISSIELLISSPWSESSLHRAQQVSPWMNGTERQRADVGKGSLPAALLVLFRFLSAAWLRSHTPYISKNVKMRDAWTFDRSMEITWFGPPATAEILEKAESGESSTEGWYRVI